MGKTSPIALTTRMKSQPHPARDHHDQYAYACNGAPMEVRVVGRRVMMEDTGVVFVLAWHVNRHVRFNQHRHAS